MAGQVLDVLDGDALVEQVGDAGNPKRMTREVGRQASVAHPALEHPIHVIGRQGRLGQPLLFSDRGPEQGTVLRSIA